MNHFPTFFALPLLTGGPAPAPADIPSWRNGGNGQYPDASPRPRPRLEW